jgi:hypothetical protein
MMVIGVLAIGFWLGAEAHRAMRAFNDDDFLEKRTAPASPLKRE